MTSWEAQAASMVEKQIFGRGIRSERVLAAMRSVPRHYFVPKEFQDSAWIDSPLPIGDEQTISQPYMVARMTELLSPEEKNSVLEIGTGSGYQAAVLASMGTRVTSIERIFSLAERARRTLSSLCYEVSVIWSDGRERGECTGPFDRVIVTAAAPYLEEWWSEILSPGGRLVAPVEVMSGGERLLLREKKGDGSLDDTWSDYCRFVPLLSGTERPPD
ncbi:MAG: protein-L-isoaspartate(D-aspartate) O-methyltransferase [Synergistaceae bacterium]|nr:protein-L-isoaspartate(D-aspartate) O-methyltransferase [Synergistaceae bacterium]